MKQGATSLTEAWDARRSSSQNHFMLGQIMEWFYADLAGIAIDPASPGFKNILIQPQPVGDVTWARGSFNSVRGKIVSDWKRDGDKFTLRITIPPGSTASVTLPVRRDTMITEGGKPIRNARGIKQMERSRDGVVFQIDSGSYELHSEL